MPNRCKNSSEKNSNTKSTLKKTTQTELETPKLSEELPGGMQSFDVKPLQKKGRLKPPRQKKHTLNLDSGVDNYSAKVSLFRVFRISRRFMRSDPCRNPYSGNNQSTSATSALESRRQYLTYLVAGWA